jgi:hypothetical protein
MKNTLTLTIVAAAIAAQAQSISWNENNGGTIPSSGVAGVAPAVNWNNSIGGMSLLDNSGAASGVSFTISGTWGAWGIAPISAGPDGDGTYNRTLLDGYANTSSGIGPEVFNLSGISYSSYDLIVYFSSDTANRTGTIADGNSGITYDFTTVGQPAISGANSVLTQTTDTTGGNPTSDYAIFTGLTGSSDTLTLDMANGGGIAGFQIESVPEPGTMALVCLGGFALLAWKRQATKEDERLCPDNGQSC